MSAADVAKVFRAVHKLDEPDEEPDEVGRQRRRRRRRVPKPRPLTDKTNLDRYLLMKRLTAFPNVRVFRQAVEDWPKDRLDDFTTLFLADAEAQRVQDKRVRQLTDSDWAKAKMDEIAARTTRPSDGGWAR